MKRTSIVISTVILACFMLSGCAGNKDIIAKAATSSRQDIFQEVNSSQTTPSTGQLNIEFQVKSFRSRFINNYTKDTDPPYTTVINIDGQATVLTDEGVMEELAGKAENNPEVGTGWRYKFKKTLSLKTGKHRISVAVPTADVIVEKEIELQGGENVLKLLPVYRTPLTKRPNYPVFSSGISGLKVVLNNYEL